MGKDDKKIRKRSRTILIALTIVFGLLFLPVLLFSFFSAFAYDSGSDGVLRNTFALSLFYLPYVMVLSVIAAWVCYAKKKYKLATWVILLPFVNVILFILSIILIVTLCNGDFACF